MIFLLAPSTPHHPGFPHLEKSKTPLCGRGGNSRGRGLPGAERAVTATTPSRPAGRPKDHVQTPDWKMQRFKTFYREIHRADPDSVPGGTPHPGNDPESGMGYGADCRAGAEGRGWKQGKRESRGPEGVVKPPQTEVRGPSTHTCWQVFKMNGIFLPNP